MGCLRAAWENVPTRCALMGAPASRVTLGTLVTVPIHLSEDGTVVEVGETVEMNVTPFD